jgi:hypothetical protein
MPRFMRKGRTKVFFIPAAAAPAALTVAEITAGDELTPELAEMNGFTFSNSPIMVPDMDNAYTSQIGGEDTAAESSLTFYEKTGGDAANPIRVALAKDTPGFVVIVPEGLAGATPAAGDDYEIWPAVVTSNARTYTVANEAAQYAVSFSITSPPSEGTVAA